MKCKKCGSEIEDGNKFCTHCGAKTDEAPLSAGEPAAGKPVKNGKIILTAALCVIAAAIICVIVILLSHRSLGEDALLSAFADEVADDYLEFAAADYDGDGTLEAFGITGINDGATGINDGVDIWYVNSSGECEVVISDLSGTYSGTASAGEESFLVWEQEEGGTGSVIMGVADGEPFEASISRSDYHNFKAEDDKYTATYVPPEDISGTALIDIEAEVELEYDDEEHDFNDPAETLLTAFKNEVTDYLYFVPGDYDGDGTMEAYGITGNQADSFGLHGNVSIWFISSDGECTLARSNTYGVLKEMITVPNGLFMTWCVTAGGSGTSALIYGCKDGEEFEPDVSGQYAGFGDRTMSYMFSDVNDFDELNCDYIGYYSYFKTGGGHVWDPIAFDYDPDTREFNKVQIADYDYDKILTGDFSDFAGEWQNGKGGTHTVLDDGTSGETKNETADSFRLESDGYYAWSVGDMYSGYWVYLYPIGVDVIAYDGTVVDTDTSMVRLYILNGDVINDPDSVYYKQ